MERMQRIYCHNCLGEFTVRQDDWDGLCPRCLEGFCEVVQDEAPAEQQQQQQQQQQHGAGYTFRLPGGGGTVHIMVGGGDMGLGLGMGHPAGFPHDAFIGPGADPLQFLQALMGGAPFGGQDLVFGGLGDYNQEEMDRIITQLMNQYQPQSRETARRVRDTLPRLTVRPRGQPGNGIVGDDSEMGMASVCAGEPCSVCHEEFESGVEVVELPCQHCFHECCLMPWLESHNTCPVCRMELPTEQGESGSASTSRASSRRQQQQAQRGGEGTWMGSLNGLLHSIAQRWEQAHADGTQAGSTSAATAAPGRPEAESGTQPPASTSRHPSSSSWGAEPASMGGIEPSASQVRMPESPRTAAGRAAATRAAAAWPPPEERMAPGRSTSAERAAAPPAAAAGAGGGSASQPDAGFNEEGGGSSVSLGALMGGALGAVVGGALSAMLGGRNRRGSGHNE